MPGFEPYFQSVLLPEEHLIELIDSIQCDCVTSSLSHENHSTFPLGAAIALTNLRTILLTYSPLFTPSDQLKDTRMISIDGGNWLSERLVEPKWHPDWPYQAQLSLSGFVVFFQTKDKEKSLALSRLLTRAFLHYKLS